MLEASRRRLVFLLCRLGFDARSLARLDLAAVSVTDLASATQLQEAVGTVTASATVGLSFDDRLTLNPNSKLTVVTSEVRNMKRG